MNHASITWLRRVRLALIGYSIFLLVAYILVISATRLTPLLSDSYTLALFGSVAVHLLFEAITRITPLKNKPWLTAYICTQLAFISTIIVVEHTGYYQSPFVVGFFLMIFLAGAAGIYASISLYSIILSGFVLGLIGFLVRPTNVTYGLIVLTVSALAVWMSNSFWRRHYTTHNSTSDVLSSSLSKEQAKSDIILNAIEDGVVLIDNNNTIRVFNPGAVKITGWSAEEAAGLDYNAVLHLVNDKNEDYQPEANPFRRATAEKKTIRDNKAILVTRSDKRVDLNISASPLLDGNNNVTGAVCVFRDVSEERGEEKRRAEFISTASHEMRTPVAAIEGYLALALNDRVSKVDSKAREYLEKAHASTQHLGKLFQDLLTSAKAEDGRLSNHPLVLEMGELLEKLTDDLRFTAEKKGLHMEFVMGTATNDRVIDASHGVGGNKVIRPLYYVQVDPERIREVITNLFDNAVKYTESGNVSIGLTGNNEVVQIYIKDTGPGIPPEDIPHLFQKFYRVDNSSTRTIGGTGLGLFICRKIVELYGGRIWVESQLSKGSTFFVNLPRLTAQKATQLQAAETTAASPLSTPNNS